MTVTDNCKHGGNEGNLSYVHSHVQSRREHAAVNRGGLRGDHIKTDT